jgi:hypothetical protein
MIAGNVGRVLRRRAEGEMMASAAAAVMFCTKKRGNGNGL